MAYWASLDQLQQMRATWGPCHTQPLILVGNKCDLVTLTGGAHDTAAALTQSWGTPFVETSAKTRQGVEEAFSLPIHEIQWVQEAMLEAGGKKAHHQKAVCGCGCSVLKISIRKSSPSPGQGAIPLTEIPQEQPVTRTRTVDRDTWTLFFFHLVRSFLVTRGCLVLAVLSV